VKERLPRFASSDELFGAEMRTESTPRPHPTGEADGSHSAPRAVSEFGIPSTLRSAPPANGASVAGDLDVQLREFLETHECDVEAFDNVLRREGFTAADLRSTAMWANDTLYIALVSALSAASRSYVFDASRRPAAGFRETLRALGQREGPSSVGRAMGRLALDFDPVYWSQSDGPMLTFEELASGSDLWEEFVRRSSESAERRRTGSVAKRFPWNVELTLELSMHEFRALLERHGTGSSPTRRDVLRSALIESDPTFAVHALTIFLVSNSDELARALDPYDEPVVDR
jgi:hypothetical protein